MVEVKRATIREEDGHQVIVLPDDVHFDGPEVSVLHDVNTGDITVRAIAPSTSWEEFMAFRNSLDIPEEEWQLFDDAIRESRRSARLADPENRDELLDET